MPKTTTRPVAAWLSAPLRQGLCALRLHWQALPLDRQFAIVAAFVTFLGLAVIGEWVSSRIKVGVTESAAAAAALHMDSFVAPLVQELAVSEQLTARSQEKLDLLVREALAIRLVSVKVWRPDGTVVYSNIRDRIGRKYPITPDFQRALNGQIASTLAGRPHEGDDYDPGTRGGPQLEIYAPVFEQQSSRIIAVVEYYSLERHLAAEMARATRQSWLVIAVVALSMMLALSGIVQAGARTIARQRRLVDAQIRELERLADQNRILHQRERRAHQTSVGVNERNLRRIGADLHDDVAQQLSLALLLLPDANGVSVNARHIDRSRSAISEALREIRAISAGLMLHEIRGADLEQVIGAAVEAHMRRTKTDVDCELQLPSVEVTESLKICAFRFVQEGLTNAFKHAGAKGQRVRATGTPQEIEIIVSDHGPGLRNSLAGSTHEALGLAGLRSRLATVGGKLVLESSDNGVVLRAIFDLLQAGLLDENDVGAG